MIQPPGTAKQIANGERSEALTDGDGEEWELDTSFYGYIPCLEPSALLIVTTTWIALVAFGKEAIAQSDS
jgi:hypothetical protein